MKRSKEAAKVVYRDDQLAIKVVTSHDELDQIRAVRAISFMEEQGIPFGPVNDANDFQATHVLLTCDGEPIGCSRLRWFNGFAQAERTAIRPSYRTDVALKRVIDFLVTHSGKKGYPRILTHAAPLYARLWTRRYGFSPVEGRPHLNLPGYGEPLIELERKTPVPVDAVTESSPANIIHRIEGAWDQPTAIELGPLGGVSKPAPTFPAQRAGSEHPVSNRRDTDRRRPAALRPIREEAS